MHAIERAPAAEKHLPHRVPVSLDQAVADIEIEKAVAEVAAPAAGVFRRQVAAVGETVPVGGLIGVIAGADVPAEAIDRFVSAFRPAPLA